MRYQDGCKPLSRHCIDDTVENHFCHIPQSASVTDEGVGEALVAAEFAVADAGADMLCTGIVVLGVALVVGDEVGREVKRDAVSDGAVLYQGVQIIVLSCISLGIYYII